MAEIKTKENASEALDQDQTDGDSYVSSSCAMWRNLSGPSSIQWPQLNLNNSHLCISSKPLIED